MANNRKRNSVPRSRKKSRALVRQVSVDDVVVASTSMPSAHSKERSVLFSSVDVLCGRGKANWNHGGNIVFREMIRNHVFEYRNLTQRGQKIDMIKKILGKIKDQGSRFLKPKEGSWVEMTNQEAREKVAHSLRDHVAASAKQLKDPLATGVSTLVSSDSSSASKDALSSIIEENLVEMHGRYERKTSAIHQQRPEIFSSIDIFESISPFDFDLTSLQNDISQGKIEI